MSRGFEAQSSAETYGLVVVVLLVVVPPLAGSASVLLCVSELPAAPSLYVSCLVTAFPFHPVPCLVEVVLEPFGPEVTVVVDEPGPRNALLRQGDTGHQSKRSHTSE